MEQTALNITIITSHALEIIAAFIIAAALVRLLYQYARSLVSEGNRAAVTSRLGFGSAVAVALELLLGADVLATAVSPGWNDIGKLAAIAILRTGLNYFLGRELREAPRTAG